MIINKILSPFHTNTPKDHTPRLLRNKHNTSHIKHLRASRETTIEKEILHFDDSLCFRQGNHHTSRVHQLISQHTIKCHSQIIAVKVIEGSPLQRSPFERSPHCTHHLSPHQQQKDLQSVRNCLEIKPERRHHRNNTSYSSRKQFRSAKNHRSTPLYPEQDSKWVINQSASISGPKDDHSESVSPQKHNPIKFQWQDSICELKGSHKQKSAGEHKSSNFMQYSIIKPKQIKSLALLRRMNEKEHFQKKRNDHKSLYMQMMQQLEQKQAIMQRHPRTKEQIYIPLKRQASDQDRQPHFISIRPHLNIPVKYRMEDKNELKPWEIEGQITQTNLTDIL